MNRLLKKVTPLSFGFLLGLSGCVPLVEEEGATPTEPGSDLPDGSSSGLIRCQVENPDLITQQFIEDEVAETLAKQELVRSLTPPEIITPSDDTFVHINGSGPYGQNNSIPVKRSGGGAGATVRKGLIEFDIPNASSRNLASATLLLDVAYFTDSAGATSATFNKKEVDALKNLCLQSLKQAAYILRADT